MELEGNDNLKSLEEVMEEQRKTVKVWDGKKSHLSLEERAEIRKIGNSQPYNATAKQFGVARTTIRNVVLGISHDRKKK